MGSRLHVFSGKGGVGKTSAATAFAKACADAGERVLLAEFNGGDRASQLLRADPVGSDLREVLQRLYVVDMNPEDAIREYALLTFRFEAVYSAVFENRFVRHFLRLIPSLRELVMLGKLWFHHQEARTDGTPRFDTIVLDAPATGHAISMLRAPAVVQRTVPAGPLRDNASKIERMLVDHGELNVVTTAEEMAVSEARELERAASDLIGIRVGTTFINQRLTSIDAESVTRLERAGGDLSSLAEALRTRSTKVETGENHLRRLPKSMLDNAVSLPRLVSETDGAQTVEYLARVIDTQLVLRQ
ncbi:MAG: ArsA-related P-loop ATPase [Myxococcota bacterium]